MKVKEFYEQVDREIIKHYKDVGNRKYYVSMFGEIYSSNKDNENKVRKLKKQVTPHGYLTIVIDKKTHKVHRLVAKLFVNNRFPDMYDVVDHINDLRFDNRASNLQWTTREHNNIKSRESVTNTRRKQKEQDEYCYDGSFMYEDYLVNKFRGNRDPYNEYLEKNEEFYG